MNYNRNPILGSAYKMVSRQFFGQYAKEIDIKGPKSLKECAALYSGCRGPTDPISEDNNNSLDENVNSKKHVVVDEDDVEESRAVKGEVAVPATEKPKLDQVQRFVVGSKKIQ